MGRTYRLCPKASVRLPVAEKKRLRRCDYSSIRAVLTLLSSFTINASILQFGARKWSIKAATLRWKLRPNRCRQRHRNYWQHIGTRHRRIQFQQYRRRVLYDVKFCHNSYVTDNSKTDRETDTTLCHRHSRKYGRPKTMCNATNIIPRLQIHLLDKQQTITTPTRYWMTSTRIFTHCSSADT